MINVDADVIQADWLRIIARMHVMRAMHPELTDAEVRVVAEGRPIWGACDWC